ncbi:MAG: hypothetical protein M0Q13_09105 [Methanothrix sp.]|nr:hypothetical protein [Methanothrix sp.]
MTLTESDIEEAALSRLASLGYTVTSGPDITSGKPATFYLGPLPKVISCEIMINNVKNSSEIKK